ncbi:MAG: DUF3310 domain-containing protein [Paraclostridium sp.]
MAFKAGDKVKCVAKHCGGSYGKEYDVIEMTNGGAVRVVRGGRVCTFHPANLELVIPEEEVIFEVGDIVDCILNKNRLFNSETYEITSIDLENRWCSVQGETGLEDYDVPLNWFKKKEKKEFHSSHYESESIEPIEFMMSNKMDFCRASIVKYAFRAGKKEGQESLDIKKIIDYALLLATQEGIEFTKEDAQSIIDYRFSWKEGRQ